VEPEANEALRFARQFTVRDGRIVDPGKFEGERPYVPYLYMIVLDGGGEDTRQRDVVKVQVTGEDKALFPELKRRRIVKLWYSEYGFVQEV
jgi:hypothetical protein